MIERRRLGMGALGFVLAGFAAAAIFLTRPGIDLGVAGLFAEGANGFALRHHGVPKFFNSLINLLALLMALFSILGGLCALRMRIPVAGLWARHYGFLLGALALGPGLIANALFKENWGRARPRNIVEFGGTAEFSPPLLIADQCSTNCSFVSGDASMGFYFLAVALVAPKRCRKLAVIAALVFGLFIGFVRIIQGAHFFSDVIFAGVFVGLAVLGLYHLMLGGWSAPQNSAPTLSQQLGLATGEGFTAPRGKSKLWIFFRSKPVDLSTGQ